MRIRYKAPFWYHRGTHIEEPVSETVESCMQDSGHEGGAMESISADGRAARQFVGQLVEKLADKGILTIRDLNELLDVEDLKVIEE